MLASDVVNKAARRYGDNGYVSAEENFYFQCINEGQMEIYRETGDILASTTVAATGFPWSIPTNFIRGERLLYGGLPLKEIKKLDLDSLSLNQNDYTDKGTPSSYYYWDEKVYLYPDPPASDSTSCVFEYYVFPAEITNISNVITVSDVHFNDLVTFVVARLHERNENWNAYEMLMNEFRNRISYRMEDKNKNSSYHVIRDDPRDIYS